MHDRHTISPIISYSYACVIRRGVLHGWAESIGKDASTTCHNQTNCVWWTTLASTGFHGTQWRQIHLIVVWTAYAHASQETTPRANMADKLREGNCYYCFHHSLQPLAHNDHKRPLTSDQEWRILWLILLNCQSLICAWGCWFTVPATSWLSGAWELVYCSQRQWK